MQQQNGDRVYGPYEQDGKYRVIVIRADGERVTKKFASQAEADNLVDSLRTQTCGVTMKESVDAYIKSRIASGQRFGSYQRAEYHLKKLLQLDKSSGRPVTWATKRAQQLYDEAQTGAVDTHRNALAVGKSWGRFCVKKGWLRRDPFADIEGVGRRRKGKPQLGVDESRRLTDYLLGACAAARMFGVLQPEPVAVLACLLLGPRASELVMRDVRDLDDGGTLLWIRETDAVTVKTETGKRALEVPTLLQPLLRELARDRIGTVPLFLVDAGYPTRHWMYYWARRLCELAKVPVISPQGFRGTHGSIAKRGGATGQLVQEQLGHASVTMTEGGAYVQRRAIQAAAAEAVELRLLKGGRP